jgi:hypothetical protein
MDQPYDRIIFFTKALTGIVMLLNIGLVLSLRAHLRFEREHNAAGGLGSVKSPVVLGLAGLVILVNVATVFCNHEMLKAVKEIASAVK